MSKFNLLQFVFHFGSRLKSNITSFVSWFFLTGIQNRAAHRFDLGLSNLSPRQSFLVFQSALAAIFITPFAIWRLFQHNWLQALVDGGIVAFLILLFVLSFKARNLRLVAYLFAAFYIVAIWFVVWSQGSEALFWSFVAAIAIHFILRTKEAFVAVMILMLGCLYWGSDYDENMLYTYIATFLLVIVFTLQFSNRIMHDNDSLQRLANRDALTRIGNRRALDDYLLQLMEQHHQQHIESATLFMLDIDFFKQINDQYGHQMGDEVLQRLATLMSQQCSATSRVFRYGGEEFCIVSLSPLSVSARQAEALRKIIADCKLIRNRSVTVSFGLAELKAGDSIRDWIARADKALYRAKQNGRNQVQIYSD